MNKAEAISGHSRGGRRVQLLRSASLEFVAGEVVGIVGANGAGKSTFAKILAGVFKPDDGHIEIGDRKVVFQSPREALSLGVEFIPQELAYVPEMTVEENILLGAWPNRFGMTSLKAIRREAARVTHEFGLEVDLNRRMRELRLADQQVVEILKVLARGARVIVLDEPTAALTDHESRKLFKVLGRVASERTAVLFISHRLNEVLQSCHRVAVFRDGEVVATVPATATNHDHLLSLMFGPGLEAHQAGQVGREERKERLAVLGWRRGGHPSLRAVSFAVGEGEIVGLFGVRGSGVEVIADALGGRPGGVRGRVTVNGRTSDVFQTPLGARRAGISHIPPDRRKEGLVAVLSVQDNIVMPFISRFARLGILDLGRQREAAGRLAQAFQVRMARLSQRVGQLSGGNRSCVDKDYACVRALLPGPDCVKENEIPDVPGDEGSLLRAR